MARNTVMIAVARRMARFQLMAFFVSPSGMTTRTTAIRSPTATPTGGTPSVGTPGAGRTSWQRRHDSFARTVW